MGSGLVISERRKKRTETAVASLGLDPPHSRGAAHILVITQEQNENTDENLKESRRSAERTGIMGIGKLGVVEVHLGIGVALDEVASVGIDVTKESFLIFSVLHLVTC
jgi:hypothetical protein